ncbi:lipoyl(octanoyl) transferase LipB [Yinghuangia sp. YIM S09857]|uniref:lipoyl(octanoyl) transferase LipB n=1 Tax=Yinghuangia sp. YIM S09857 TaxID=3436929 RepID=UPI003F535A24
MERVDLGEVAYDVAAEQMAGWVRERQEGRAGDRLFLLSHPPVVTHSARTPAGELPGPEAGIALVEVDRGGHATYHGPGQLVGYLVMNVREGGPGDVVRWMELGLVEALGSLGFPAVRRETPSGGASLVGVWTPDLRKIASIGMRIRKGVTSHGFALNVSVDLAPFTTFTACSLPGVKMTSIAELAEESGRLTPSEEAVRDAVWEALSGASVSGPAS